ncbi:unnamed protein product, partial [Choristocarpus tenellus]
CWWPRGKDGPGPWGKVEIPMLPGALIHSYCQVIGTGEDGSSPCLIASVERTPRYGGGVGSENTILRRYLFNVGEGTQRFCGEHHIKLAKVNKIFMTGTGAEEHAGLPGVVLSLSHLGVPMLEIFGPEGVEKLYLFLSPATEALHGLTSLISTFLCTSPGEAQCSFALGDEHMHVHCGVVDPARLMVDLGRAMASNTVDCCGSSSSSNNGSSSSSSDNDGTSSSDDEISSNEESDSPCEDQTGKVCAGVGHGVGTTEDDHAEKRFKGSTEDGVSVQATIPNERVEASDRTVRPSAQFEASQPMADAVDLNSNKGDGEINVGVPYRGPVVLYRCQVKHGAGASFLVLCCPNVSYIKAVKDHSLTRVGVDSSRTLFVFHLSPAVVVRHPLYTPLLKLKGEHIIVASDKNYGGPGGLQHYKIAERSVQLNTVSQEAFPLHFALRTAPLEGVDLPRVPEPVKSDQGKRLHGQALLKAVLLPPHLQGVDSSEVRPRVDVTEIREDMEKRLEEAGLTSERDRLAVELGATIALGRKEHQVVCNNGKTPDTACVEMVQLLSRKRDATGASRPTTAPFSFGAGLSGAQLYFLGTGSAAPSKNRGCSGILLRLPRWPGVPPGPPLRLLLDAGEGTLGHLERQFGQEGAKEEVHALDCIWISHKHADHHTGLFRLLVEHHRGHQHQARQRGPVQGPKGTPKQQALLTVVAPTNVLSFLEACNIASGGEVSYRSVNCNKLQCPGAWVLEGGGYDWGGP